MVMKEARILNAPIAEVIYIFQLIFINMLLFKNTTNILCKIIFQRNMLQTDWTVHSPSSFEHISDK